MGEVRLLEGDLVVDYAATVQRPSWRPEGVTWIGGNLEKVGAVRTDSIYRELLGVLPASPVAVARPSGVTIRCENEPLFIGGPLW